MVKVNYGGTLVIMSEADACAYRQAYPETEPGFLDIVGMYTFCSTPTHYYCLECNDIHPVCSLRERFEHKLAVALPDNPAQQEVLRKAITEPAAMAIVCDSTTDILMNYKPDEPQQVISYFGPAGQA